MNYGELKAAVQLWINRDDLGTNGSRVGPSATASPTLIESFISLAERKIFRQLKSPANEKVAYPILLPDGDGNDPDRITVPSDLLTIKALKVDGIIYSFMEYFNFTQKFPQSPSSSYAGIPNFTRETNELVFPTYIKNKGIDSNGKTIYPEITIYYWADLSGMNDDNETNAVLRTCPDLYLYGALIEAEAYLVNDPRVPLWNQKYQEAYASINDFNHQIDYNSSTLVVSNGY